MPKSTLILTASLTLTVSVTAQAQSTSLHCPTLSSGAAALTGPGPITALVNLGQPLIGLSTRPPTSLHAGVIPCLGRCYPDCDQGTGPGTLDIFDFLCFQNRFAALDPYACDCDTSSGPGVCDIFDFLCFQNAFAAGCP